MADKRPERWRTHVAPSGPQCYNQETRRISPVPGPAHSAYVGELTYSLAFPYGVYHLTQRTAVQPHCEADRQGRLTIGSCNENARNTSR